jgi:hydroxymethylpyrimidine pyrophosphatase-like HAD family hydrolase
MQAFQTLDRLPQEIRVRKRTGLEPLLDELQDSTERKVLATDADGTVVPRGIDVVAGVPDIMAAAPSYNVIPTLVTIRAWIAARPIGKRLGLPETKQQLARLGIVNERGLPLPIAGGTEIVGYPNGDLYERFPLQTGLPEMLIDFVERASPSWGAHLELSAVGEYFVGRNALALARTAHYVPKPVFLTSLKDVLPLRPTIAVVHAFPKAVPVIYRKLSKDLAGSATVTCASREVQVTDLGHNKWSGVEWIAGFHNIDPAERAVALGNETDDAEVLRRVAFGIAVGESPPVSVLKGARAITKMENVADVLAGLFGMPGVETLHSRFLA